MAVSTHFWAWSKFNIFAIFDSLMANNGALKSFRQSGFILGHLAGGRHNCKNKLLVHGKQTVRLIPPDLISRAKAVAIIDCLKPLASNSAVARYIIVFSLLALYGQQDRHIEIYVELLALLQPLLISLPHHLFLPLAKAIGKLPFI